MIGCDSQPSHFPLLDKALLTSSILLIFSCFPESFDTADFARNIPVNSHLDMVILLIPVASRCALRACLDPETTDSFVRFRFSFICIGYFSFQRDGNSYHTSIVSTLTRKSHTEFRSGNPQLSLGIAVRPPFVILHAMERSSQALTCMTATHQHSLSLITKRNRL